MARAAESTYSAKLRQVARQIDAIVRGLAPDGIVEDPGPIVRTLEAYSAIIGPWATSVARYMIADISRRNAKAWKEHGQEVGRALRAEIAHAPTGMVYQALLDEQVRLIRSMPLDAARRVHDLVTEGRLQGKRHTELAKEILAQGRVSASKATLIARTETSRSAVSLTQARAMFVGSQGYIWRTVEDADVRPTHQKMEGRYVRWDTPPKTDKGLAPYHAGCGPNCRCYPDPVLPND